MTKTKTEELIEECIILEGRYEKQLARMLKVTIEGLRRSSDFHSVQALEIAEKIASE